MKAALMTIIWLALSAGSAIAESGEHLPERGEGRLQYPIPTHTHATNHVRPRI